MKYSRILWLIVPLLATSAAFIWWPKSPQSTNVPKELAAAQGELRAGRYAAAIRQARELIRDKPDCHEARLIAAEAETRMENYEAAVQLYDQVVEPGDELLARVSAADIERHVGNLKAAERRFQEILKSSPQHIVSHRRLAWIFNIQGSRQMALPHLSELCRQNVITVDELVLFGSPEILVESDESVNELSAQSPQAVGIKLSQALRSHQNGQQNTAQNLLHELAPDMATLPAWFKAEYHVLAGRILIETGAVEGLDEWRRTTLAANIDHPSLWLLHGQYLRSIAHPDAEACLRRAAAGLPKDHTAQHQLADLLTANGKDEEAQVFRERAKQLRDLKTRLDSIIRKTDDLKAVLSASDLCYELDRHDEAQTWQLFARQLIGTSIPPEWAAESLNRRFAVPATSYSVLPGYERRDDLALLERLRMVADRDIQSSETVHGGVFENEAEQLGLHFQYTSGLPGRLSGRPLYSFPGGGIGVLDIDLDMWPDLYFPQATRWPPPADSEEFLDNIIRNVRGEAATDVTRLCGIREDSFSHGVAVGDIDNDGFPDIYVANILQNRLFQNLGDGTFAEATMEAMPRMGWTTSCVVADLSGDGLPDLYDVNYYQGDNVYEAVCKKEGLSGTCVSFAFEPAPDLFLENNGEMGFVEKAKDVGLHAQGGNGLGAIAADLNNDGLCDLFVANDADPNFLFVQRLDDGVAGFRESAGAFGVAVDEMGNPQACMGIAVADCDGDRRLDLFVTNYYQEHNTLYSQVLPGIFSDGSRSSGLYRPGYSKLGFGTQFIDMDLDTWPDLFVANGHVDDFQHTGAEYAMHPQIFMNRGKGTFEESRGSVNGDYFQATHLGRGAASLDWNRDGRPDIAVSHLDHPVALLINETPTQNHFVKLKIHRTRLDRDAIGSRVQLTAKQRSIEMQVIAGSGYMAANEATLLFGLGQQTGPCQVVVDWCRGAASEYTVHSDSCWGLVEGRQQAYLLPD